MTIKELLSLIPIYETKIEIDGRSSRQNMRRTITYLRREICSKDNVGKVEIKFEDSVKDNLIQLADLIAGSVNRFFSKDKTDSGIYLGILKKKIAKIKRLD